MTSPSDGSTASGWFVFNHLYIEVFRIYKCSMQYQKWHGTIVLKVQMFMWELASKSKCTCNKYLTFEKRPSFFLSMNAFCAHVWSKLRMEVSPSSCIHSAQAIWISYLKLSSPNSFVPFLGWSLPLGEREGDCLWPDVDGVSSVCRFDLVMTSFLNV